MTSWEANKQTKSTKRARQTPQGMAKGRARSNFLCEVEEEGYKEAKKSTKREKRRDGNQHPLEQRKEERATGIMGVNQRNPPPSSGRFISQRVTKSEPRGSAVILDPPLTFYPREISLRNKETSLARGFSFEGQGKGKTGNKLMKRLDLMRKKGE